ncbi:MAG: single-stranded-DNA-specific exonuclease RecJ [Desulfuromonas sp.]|nr:MAG: single-stranded-DNA-specific exonuclease RecJ [Desulfuromonas sp.]
MSAAPARRWKLRAAPADESVLHDIVNTLGVDPLVARVLTSRGLDTSESVRSYLSSGLNALPDPAQLVDMEAATQRLERALRQQEPISVHGDFDVDGITGCTLLVESLRSMGGRVDFHIPRRLQDGYGLSAEAIRAAAQSGCRVLVSVDCGVSAVEEAALAAELGLDLIVVDHHQPGDILPRCYALIDPHRSDCSFPDKNLSGVGVAFFLLIALRRTLRQSGYFNDRTEPDLRQGLDLVALGTIADIVPLLGVNRILVRAGLERIDTAQRVGIQALKAVAAVQQVSSGAVGFKLAPRLNAAGRLEDATLGVDLLLNRDPRQAAQQAQCLDDLNCERQQVEKQVLEQALSAAAGFDLPACHSLVLADERWHPGVIGIVASRLVDRFHRPVVLIALEGSGGKGSARSIAGFNLFEALGRCEETLDRFGGHAMAAGLTIDREYIDLFRQQFEMVARQELTADTMVKTMSFDGDIPLDLLTEQRVRSLDMLAPYGAGNPQPVFVARQVQVNHVVPVGTSHLRFEAQQGGARVSCIAFGQADRTAELVSPVDLMFRVGMNHWRGRDSVQLQIVDFCQPQAI